MTYRASSVIFSGSFCDLRWCFYCVCKVVPLLYPAGFCHIVQAETGKLWLLLYEVLRSLIRILVLLLRFMILPTTKNSMSHYINYSQWVKSPHFPAKKLFAVILVFVKATKLQWYTLFHHGKHYLKILRWRFWYVRSECINSFSLSTAFSNWGS
jgi:hypothetical protein